jgi:hypothetical protein
LQSPLETIKQMWNVLNFYPDFHRKDVAARTERFILEAAPEQLFQVQKDLFAFATPYFLEDHRISRIMQDFDGREVGLVIEGAYESILTFHADGFSHRLGRGRECPVVFIIVSREAYRDGVLKRVDPIKLVLTRKLRVKGKATLARWALPHWQVLVDQSLFDKFLGYQDEVEDWIDVELRRLGY